MTKTTYFLIILYIIVGFTTFNFVDITQENNANIKENNKMIQLYLIENRDIYLQQQEVRYRAELLLECMTVTQGNVEDCDKLFQEYYLEDFNN